MTEYIKREDAYITLTDYYHHSTEIQHMALKEALDRVPAADVRPVVLCLDCKWCHAGYCEKYDDLIPFGCAKKPWEDWFCADGKR